MDRTILHLVPRPDADLVSTLADLAGNTALVVSTRDPACFMGDASPFAGAVESTDRDAVVEAARELAPLVDVERSMILAGSDRVFIQPNEPAPVRYQYLMHRRSDYTHAQYLTRYESIHSEFGLRTPKIDGYVQLHVDLDASRELAKASGMTAEPCDSMSELHLRSVEHFVEGIVADPDLGKLAAEDEERFVDRPRSFGFAHRIVQGSTSC